MLKKQWLKNIFRPRQKWNPRCSDSRGRREEKKEEREVSMTRGHPVWLWPLFIRSLNRNSNLNSYKSVNLVSFMINTAELQLQKCQYLSLGVAGINYKCQRWLKNSQSFPKNNGFMMIRKAADQCSDDHLGWGEASVHLCAFTWGWWTALGRFRYNSDESSSDILFWKVWIWAATEENGGERNRGGGLMIMMKGMDLRHQWSDEYCWRRVRRPCLRTQDSISYLYPLMMKNTCHLRGRTWRRCKSPWIRTRSKEKTSPASEWRSFTAQR